MTLLPSSFYGERCYGICLYIAVLYAVIPRTVDSWIAKRIYTTVYHFLCVHHLNIIFFRVTCMSGLYYALAQFGLSELYTHWPPTGPVLLAIISCGRAYVLFCQVFLTKDYSYRSTQVALVCRISVHVCGARVSLAEPWCLMPGTCTLINHWCVSNRRSWVISKRGGANKLITKPRNCLYNL